MLPKCLSSVYLFYDPEYDFLSLGILSALYEIYYVREIVSRAHYNMDYYYMGFYIETCQKMRYKSQYRPSQLLDPFRYTWVQYDHSIKWIQKRGFTLLDVPKEILEDEDSWKQQMEIEQDRMYHSVSRSDIQSVTLSLRGLVYSVNVSPR